jgi:hypothetical protein
MGLHLTVADISPLQDRELRMMPLCGGSVPLAISVFGWMLAGAAHWQKSLTRQNEYDWPGVVHGSGQYDRISGKLKTSCTVPRLGYRALPPAQLDVPALAEQFRRICPY